MKGLLCYFGVHLHFVCSMTCLHLLKYTVLLPRVYYVAHSELWSTLSDRRWCQPSVVPSAMFMHVLPLCQMNQSILWYYTYILLTEHITDDRMFVEDTSAHPSLTGEEEEDKMEFKHIALHPRRQHTILHIYIFCAVFMKLQQGYIGNIILQLAEFGTQTFNIWLSSTLIFGGLQMGGWVVGGWDYPVAGMRWNHS